MARKITVDSVHAFLHGQEFSRENMRVEIRPFQSETFNSVILLLHNNPIARRQVGRNTSVWICDGGWQTRTTKDRLNALPGVRVHQAKGEWYLNDELWDGSWTEVADIFNVRRRVDGAWVCTDPTYKVHVFPSEAAARAYAQLGRANYSSRVA